MPNKLQLKFIADCGAALYRLNHEETTFICGLELLPVDTVLSPDENKKLNACISKINEARFSYGRKKSYNDKYRDEGYRELVLRDREHSSVADSDIETEDDFDDR